MSYTYDGRLWKSLEFEEQAHVRTLMRSGIVRIEGKGPGRRVALVPVCINPKAREAGWRVAFCKCPLCITR